MLMLTKSSLPLNICRRQLHAKVMLKIVKSANMSCHFKHTTNLEVGCCSAKDLIIQNVYRLNFSKKRVRLFNQRSNYTNSYQSTMIAPSLLFLFFVCSRFPNNYSLIFTSVPFSIIVVFLFVLFIVKAILVMIIDIIIKLTINTQYCRGTSSVCLVFRFTPVSAFHLFCDTLQL